MKMKISEVFGYAVEDLSDTARTARTDKRCPFKNSPCTKSSKSDPIGVCSLSDGTQAAALCPDRFLENDRIFNDAARLAFGEGATYGVFPEVRILKVEAEEEGAEVEKSGKWTSFWE